MLRLGRAEFKGAKRGAVATEYAILLALIGVVSIVAVVAAGKDVKRVYCEAASAIAHANGRAFWLCDEAEPLSEELVAEEDAIAEKPEDCAEGCVFAGFGSGKVAKLSTDGQYLWESDTLTSKVYAVASDKEGNIYAGGEDYVLVKLDPSGKELWRADTFAAVMTIAVSDDGFVYVGTGSGHSSVRKFRTSDGMVMATERVATPVSVDNGRDWIVGVTVSKSGFVYAATKYGAIAKLDPNGEMTTLWQEEATQAYLGDLDIDDTGNLYTVGSTIDSREADMGRDEEAFMLVEDATARYGINSNTNLAGQFFGAALSPNGDYAVIGWRQWPDGDYGTYVTNMRPGMGSNPNKSLCCKRERLDPQAQWHQWRGAGFLGVPVERLGCACVGQIAQQRSGRLDRRRGRRAACCRSRNLFGQLPLCGSLEWRSDQDRRQWIPGLDERRLEIDHQRDAVAGGWIRHHRSL
jgi:Flp pilus assembly pilin Flp